jgi:hypothetical protein
MEQLYNEKWQDKPKCSLKNRPNSNVSTTDPT